MIKEIFEHLAIMTAHLAQKIIEEQKIDEFCSSPCDLAVIAHEKRFVYQEIVGKMLTHISEFKYLERRGDVFVLADVWRRTLPGKIESEKYLREKNAFLAYQFQEILSKRFIETIKNETQKYKLSDLLYYIDAIDGSKGLQSIRSEAIAALDFQKTPENIFDFNFGLGYSAIQIANLYQGSDVYSLSLNTSFRDASEYSITRNAPKNLFFTKDYPSELVSKAIKEKVGLIFMMNPLGVDIKNIKKYLNIAEQVSKKGTKLLLVTPFSDSPLHCLFTEWLSFCVENMGDHENSDFYRVTLPNYGFEIDHLDTKTNILIATFSKEQ